MEIVTKTFLKKTTNSANNNASECYKKTKRRTRNPEQTFDFHESFGWFAAISHKNNFKQETYCMRLDIS